jgi:predicted acetyltransferase
VAQVPKRVKRRVKPLRRACLDCGMPKLVPPTVAVRDSYLAALDEFRAEGRLGEDDTTGHAQEVRALSGTDEAAFATYVEALRERALEEGRRPEGWVPDTVLWYVDGNEWIGRVDIRHRLVAALMDVGGHIGYEVRPSARRRGHATAMLREALPLAGNLGIRRALLTCRVDNVASRKVIESNGGQFDDQRGQSLRFWVPTQR